MSDNKPGSGKPRSRGGVAPGSSSQAELARKGKEIRSNTYLSYVEEIKETR